MGKIEKARFCESNSRAQPAKRHHKKLLSFFSAQFTPFIRRFRCVFFFGVSNNNDSFDKNRCVFCLDRISAQNIVLTFKGLRFEVQTISDFALRFMHRRCRNRRSFINRSIYIRLLDRLMILA